MKINNEHKKYVLGLVMVLVITILSLSYYYAHRKSEMIKRMSYISAVIHSSIIKQQMNGNVLTRVTEEMSESSSRQLFAVLDTYANIKSTKAREEFIDKACDLFADRIIGFRYGQEITRVDTIEAGRCKLLFAQGSNGYEPIPQNYHKYIDLELAFGYVEQFISK